MEIYQTEEQQVEAIKGYWQENGNMIIAGIVLGFAGFIGFNYYKENQLNNELAIADSYQALVESATEDKAAFNENAKKFISENSDSGYAALTSLALAKEAVTDKNWAEAQTQLNAAIASAPSDGIKGIATLRLARIQIQQSQFEDALTTLAKPLPESFTAAVEEAKGDTYLLQGKKELARNAYQVAIAADGLASSPSLQMKLDDLATAVNLPVTLPTEEAAK